MVDRFEKVNCCGCGVCANVCPKHCITMKSDNEGFLYPSVDHNQCVECGLCVKKCPLTKNDYHIDNKPIAIITQTKNESTLCECTSGGFFSTLAEWIVCQGGVVYDVKYDESMNPVHAKSDTIEGVKEFGGSKYVQSITGDVYKKVKADLEEYPLVCFSGTPCQVAGLNSFLGKDYPNLILVDIVCHGVPSPKFWDKYKMWHEQKQRSCIVNAKFRSKKYGYSHSTMQLDYANGKTENIFTMDDYFLAAFFSEICSRPSCHHCHFKYENRKCDFTLFDCWDTTPYKEFVTQNGATNVFIQSSKGLKIFEQIKDKFVCHQIEVDEAINNDGVMICKSTVANKNRDLFFSLMDDTPIPVLRNKLYPLNKKIWLRSRIRDFLMMLGVYKFKK